MRKKEVKRIIIMTISIILGLSYLIDSSIEKSKYGTILKKINSTSKKQRVLVEE